jgi:hypothetical protein
MVKPAETEFLAGSSGAGINADFPPACREIRVLHALTALILFPVMLPIKSVACSCPKGGKMMKRALIGGLSVLAMIVGVSAANAQANINPNEYPRNAGERYGATGNTPYEWHGAPGPNRRGNMCVTHVDPLRGYGYQSPCPAPKAAAASAVRHKKKKRVASR